MSGQTGGAEPGRPRVICVDDDPLVLSALQRVLRHEPYEVVTTQSPAEVLRLIEDGRPSVVITDLRMPSMNGEDLIREVRERHPQIGRLMLTAYPDVASAFLRQSGSVLAKPWEDDELRAQVWERFRSAAEEGYAGGPTTECGAPSLLADFARAVENGRPVPGDRPSGR